MTRPLLIDIHTHIYTPRLVDLLRRRTINPRIHGHEGHEKLAILPSEVHGGRPIGPQYWDRRTKLSFMDRHRIDASVVSIANPWLDFLSSKEAIDAAQQANEDLEMWCRPNQDESSEAPSSSIFSAGDARASFKSQLAPSERIRAFGILPFAEGVSISALVATLQQIAGSQFLSGAIIGTRGIGKGLDDPSLDELWKSAEELQQPLFLHPHYGVGSQASLEDGLFGTKDNGHVLALALGFPIETASAASRLILSGVFDRYPSLQIILAHAGGALPLLSSRLASCVAHDPVVAHRLNHDARYYMSKFYYDAVNYGPEELEAVARIVGRAHRYQRANAVACASLDIPAATAEARNAAGRFMFGTDHPFFPPLRTEVEEASLEQQPWQSMAENLHAIYNVPFWTPEERSAVMGGTANRLFKFSSI